MTPRRIRRTLARPVATVSALAVVTLAAACGSNATDTNGGGSADPSSLSGTVTWWDTGSKAESEVYGKLIDRFEKKYPNVTVDRVYVPFDQALQKFKTAARAKKGAPDVFRSEVGWTPGLAKLGYLAPLDDTPALTKPDDFLDGPLQGAMVDGTTYGVPQVTDTLALLYNKEILDKAGIEQPPQTWDEVQEAAKKIEKKVPGVTTTYINPDSYYAWPFLYAEGADLVDTENKRITIDDKKAIAGIQAAVDLIESGAASRPDTTSGYANMQAQMASGKLAMIVDGPWATEELLQGEAFEDNPDNLGIAPVPGGSEGAGSPTGGHNLVVYAASQDLEASYRFVRFLTNADNQAKASVANNTLPTRKSAYTDRVTSDPVRAAFRKAMEQARPRPPLPDSGDLFTEFNPHYAAILSGRVSVAEGLQATAKAWKAKHLKDYEIR